MAVVLIGEGGRKEFDLLTEAIEDRGQDVVMWDMTDWPADIPLTFDVGSKSITVNSEFCIDEITGVFPWVHHIFHPSLPRFADDFATDGTRAVFMKTGQWRGVFRSLLGLFENHDATVFYPPGSRQSDGWKPLQLELFMKKDISIPDTVFTTDPERVREFVTEHSEVVYKPVVEAAWPERLSKSDLDKVPLERLSNAPVQFQEYIPGDDIRAFFLDGKVVGASRYVTDKWTFKTENWAEDAESVDLRDEVRQDVERAADVSSMRFGAADLRVTDEAHALLETNPGPRFALHDLYGDTNIASVLADALVY